MPYQIKRAVLDEALAAQLIALSVRWVQEDCCNGMVVNEQEDLTEPLWIALEGESVIGYAFGHFYTAKQKTGYLSVGSPCFSLDELYVLPERRSEGIGRALYAAMQEDVTTQARYITLATSTKDWKKVLHFYTEVVGMDFHNAFLIQPLS